MILRNVRDLILRPREFFKRLTRRPVILRAATLILATHALIVLVSLLMHHTPLRPGTVIATVFLVVIIVFIKFNVSALFLYLVSMISGGRSEHLYQQCLSVTVYSYVILMLGRLFAVALGIIVHYERGSDFSIVTLLNINNLLAALHLPAFMIFEKADVFAVWFIGVLTIGICTFSNFRKFSATFIALADWLFVAAVQESILQYLSLSFHG